MQVVIDGNVAFLPGSGTAVWFSQNKYAAFAGDKNSGTTVLPPDIIKELNIAPWGEDNLFPQRIADQISYCGVAQSALKLRATTLYAYGIHYGTMDYDEKGEEVFKPAKKGLYPEVDKWFRANNNLRRFYTEFYIDWVYFVNCFPELVLTRDGKKIAKLVHQESSDCRYKQYSDKGKIESVYISKMWGATSDLFPKFKKTDVITTVHGKPRYVDNKYVKEIPCLDPYNALEDLQRQVKNTNKRNFILPVNYPSPNKPYYQVPSWDGARLSGWIEIAAKIPELLKVMYQNAFQIKYHVEIPIKYFEDKYGIEAWQKMTPAEQDTKKASLLENMDKYLAGTENAHKTFVSYFEINRHTGQESGHIKITPIEAKSQVDKDLLTSSAANSEILFAMNINPNVVGAGSPGGPYSGSSGSGSNIREAHIVLDASLQPERELTLEPLELVAQYNGWPEDLVFRHKRVVLTTLDEGKGTKTVN